jgi:hypothetical protein
MKEAIINLINKLACCHDWKLERQTDVVDDFDDVIAKKYLYVCKKCGKFKVIRI